MEKIWKLPEGGMAYGMIPGVEKLVSRIFLGTASAPFATGEDCGKLLDDITLMGVNAIDTARVYGQSEEAIGKWLEKGGNRDRVVILSKGGHPNALGMKRINEKAIRADLEKSLEKLRTDHIDIYLLHRDDPKVPAGEIVEILNALKKEGKICAFGGSNWTWERLKEANEYARAHDLTEMSVSSPHFGLARQVNDPWGGGVTLNGDQEAQKWYENNQMPVIAHSSLGRGLMSGKLKSTEQEKATQVLDSFAMKGFAAEENFERLGRCEEIAEAKGASVAQVAMSWVFHQKMNVYAVVSTKTPARMKQNIDAISLPLTEAECRYLNLEV